MQTYFIRRFLPILLLFSPLAHAIEQTISCKVVGITDGDTFTCLHHRSPLKIRLQYIDAPELGQPFGQKAKQVLSQLAFKKQVQLQISGNDLYQRQLGVVWDGSRNLNLALVEQGMAWAYRQTKQEYQQAEQIARQKQLGLWADKNPIEPAEWRAAKRPNQTENLQTTRPTAPLAKNSGVDCSVKKYCSQFKDYATALRHFQQCGWQELDGNNDGIPCNRLYRKAQQR